MPCHGCADQSEHHPKYRQVRKLPDFPQWLYPCLCLLHHQVKEYKADLASLKEQLKQAATGASEGDAARAELGLGDNYYSTSGGC